MEELARVDSLAIHQIKEWGEILSGFETRNNYRVMDSSGEEVLLVGEERGSVLVRLFLKAARPFTLRAMAGQETVLVFRRPFRFFFSYLDVLDGSGAQLGSVTREFAWLRREYTVRDASGRACFTLFGPLLRPWTFQIMRDGREVGMIQKQWSGAMKEAFSDADNFGVTFPPDADAATKSLLLGAVFLIDFVHFENRWGD
jgi:uncharacterized protein YxjI